MSARVVPGTDDRLAKVSKDLSIERIDGKLNLDLNAVGTRVIVAALPSQPDGSAGAAARAGLRRGDELTHIDGQEISGARLAEVSRMMSAVAGRIPVRVWRMEGSADGGQGTGTDSTEHTLTIQRFDGKLQFDLDVINDRLVVSGLQNRADGTSGAAERAGMSIGDQITAVAGAAVAGLKLDAVVRLFAKSPNDVIVRVRRIGSGSKPPAAAEAEAKADAIPPAVASQTKPAVTGAGAGAGAAAAAGSQNRESVEDTPTRRARHITRTGSFKSRQTLFVPIAVSAHVKDKTVKTASLARDLQKAGMVAKKMLKLTTMANAVTLAVDKKTLDMFVPFRRAINFLVVIVSAVGCTSAFFGENLLFRNKQEPYAAVTLLKTVTMLSTGVLIALVLWRYRVERIIGTVHAKTALERQLGRNAILGRKTLILEILICLIHSPPGADYQFELSAGDYAIPMKATYTFDSVMIFFMVVLRIYLLVPLIHDLCGFHDQQSVIIGHVNRVNLDWWFTARCAFQSHPSKVLCVVSLLAIGVFSLALRIAERPLCAPWLHPDVLPSFCAASSGAANNAAATVTHDFFGNSVWNIIVTMTTVGYGDMYPSSHFGRVATILASLVGITLVACIVDAVNRSLALSDNEQRAFAALRKRQMQMQLQKLSARLVQVVYRKYRLGHMTDALVHEFLNTVKGLRTCKAELFEVERELEDLNSSNSADRLAESEFGFAAIITKLDDLAQRSSGAGSAGANGSGVSSDAVEKIAHGVSVMQERQAKMQSQIDDLHDMLFQALNKPVAVVDL